MFAKPFVVLMLGTTAIAGVATSVQAQSAAADTAQGTQASGDDALNPGEIVVTATRRAESLQKVPMSVNAVTGDQLQKLNIFDVKDVQQLAPGLELTNTTGRNNTTTLRGITFDPDQGTGPAVRVYYNEVPADAQTVYTAIYDIGQIEVLRGPQGLLRGLSAPAGSITITTRRPSFTQTEGYVQSTVTSRAGYNVQGAVSLPFSDKLALRVAGLVDGNRLNQVYNVTRGQRSKSRTESVRATLGWRPSDDFKAFLTYQYLNADNIQNFQVYGPGNTPFPGFPTRSGPPIAVSDYEATAEGEMHYLNNSHLLNLVWDWNLGPATLSFVGAHQYSNINSFRDGDSANAIPGDANNGHTRSPYKVDTGELRLTSNNDEGLGWGVGAFYTHQTGTTKVDSPGRNYFAALPPSFGLFLPINTTVIVPVKSQLWSFNGNLRYKSGPFKIEGGLRYSIGKGTTVADIYVSSPGYAPFGVAPFSFKLDGIPANLQKHTDKPLTGGINATYDLMPNLTVYVAYGHSNRGGSAGVAAPVGISDDLIRTKSEKADSWEAGFKGTMLNRRLNYSVAAYYQKINGYLSRFNATQYNCTDVNRIPGQLSGTCFTSPPAPPINNAVDVPESAFDFNYNGDAKIKGIEASLDGRVTPNWDIGLNLAYAHARYSNARLPCNDYDGSGKPNQNGTPKITGTGNVSYCVSNGRLADVPDFSLSATTEIRAPMGSITPFVRALFSYRPSVYSERVDFDYQDREILNTYVGFRTEDQRWEVSVFAKNLLNQKRITSLYQSGFASGGPAGVFNSGYHLINATNPREFGLTVNFRW